MNFSITELKKHLGPGLGLRKNRYLIEIPVPTVTGEAINILCQSAGLPERSINTTDVWHKGRRYTVRGETDFVGDYEISIIDDDQMKIRQLFDLWIKQVDNSRLNKNAGLMGSSFEELVPGGLDNLEGLVGLANQTKNLFENPSQALDFAIGQINENTQMASAAYQTDINIWQMDYPSTREGVDKFKIYGYKLQNAFPKNIGIVTLQDNEENTLSEFSVTFAFSEFIPLYGGKRDLVRGILGDQASDIANGATALIN